MNRVLKKRKTQFWALCLTVMLVFCNAMPVAALAADYYAKEGDMLASWGSSLQPGDMCYIQKGSTPGATFGYLEYYDEDDTLLRKQMFDSVTQEVGGIVYYKDKVLTYSEAGGAPENEELFRTWTVTYSYGSAGCAANMKLKAVLYTKSSISYELDGGDNPASNPNHYLEGKKEILLADASKTGYTFAGWYNDSSLTTRVTSISVTDTGAKTLYAKFVLGNYGITYVLNGGSEAGSNPSSYTYGTGVGSLADASKTGYTFAGWYSDSSFTTRVTGISATETGAKTLYAKFTPNNYGISYELDGGSNAGSNPSSYTYGTGVGSFAAAGKSGYDFAGWYSDARFTTRITSISATETGSKTLYAKFTSNSYGITYVLNGGSNAASNPSSYTYGTGVGSLAAASKSGYTFAGWYSDDAFTTRVTGISATESGSKTLYARFTPASYEITYQLDGGSNAASNPSSYCYGSGVESFADAEKTGYDFDGWYADESFTIKISSISAAETGDMTLYARFLPANYKIAYELNGGSNAASNPVSYCYGTGVESFETASKTGYVFDGWYSDAAFTTKLIAITAEETGDRILYARFTPAEYMITYELDGGSNAESNPVKYTYGAGVESFQAASRENYIFDGWYEDAALTVPVVSISKNDIGNKILYAGFVPADYEISYELDGGSNAESNPAKYTYGVGVAGFADAEKTGYTFDGWYGDEELSVALLTILATESGNKTLYAKFTPESYSITYELDGGSNAVENPAVYVYGAGVESFAAAGKEGYTFDGWYGDAEFTMPVSAIAATETGNKTLYARFTEDKTDLDLTPTPTLTPTSTPTPGPTKAIENDTVVNTNSKNSETNFGVGASVLIIALGIITVVVVAALVRQVVRKRKKK